MLTNQMSLDFSLVLITFLGTTFTDKLIFNFFKSIKFQLFHKSIIFKALQIIYIYLKGTGGRVEGLPSRVAMYWGDMISTPASAKTSWMFWWRADEITASWSASLM